MALHVQPQPFASQLESFLLAFLAVQNQPFHCQRLAVLWELLQNSIGSFDAFLVLLHFIVPNDLTEQAVLLPREGLCISVTRHLQSGDVRSAVSTPSGPLLFQCTLSDITPALRNRSVAVPILSVHRCNGVIKRLGLTSLTGLTLASVAACQ